MHGNTKIKYVASCSSSITNYTNDAQTHKYQNSLNLPGVSGRTGGQTDRHEGADSRFSQSHESAQNWKQYFGWKRFLS